MTNEVNANEDGGIYPTAPHTLAETGLPEAFVDALVCKYLFGVGEQMGRKIERDLCLPSEPVVNVLTYLKKEQHVFYKDTAMGDFKYALSDSGRTPSERSRTPQ